LTAEKGKPHLNRNTLPGGAKGCNRGQWRLRISFSPEAPSLDNPALKKVYFEKFSKDLDGTQDLLLSAMTLGVG
jgi:hypothetical protein